MTDTLLIEAVTAHRRGQLDVAERAYLALLDSSPAEFHALHGLGVLHAQRGAPAAAVPYLERAVATDPASSDAQGNLGFMLFQLGERARAAEILERAVALDPRNAAAWNSLGLTRHGDAEASFRRAIETAPGYADPWCNLAVLLLDRRRPGEAAEAARQAVALAPNMAPAHHVLGSALAATGDHRAALPEFAEAARLAPTPAARIALGGALQRAGRLDEAIRLAREALARQPAVPELHAHLGDLLMSARETTAAIESYREADRLRPGDAAAALGIGQAAGLRGDLPAAFAALDRRFELFGTLAPWDLATPRWRGEDLAGRTILLFAEQGFGDTLQFLRFVPAVAARGGRVVLAVQPPLLRLAASVAGAAEIVATDGKAPAHDLHCPLMSVPAVLGIDLATLPAEPYLAPPAGLAAERLAALPGLRVGLAWSGHPGQSHDFLRSMPLRALAPLRSLQGVSFVSLQKDVRAADASDSPGLVAPHLGDFADTAAAIRALDLVIAVDSAVAHLAGTLGAPVWTMLAYAADWRWLEDRADSPWYKSMRLFRQARPGDWDGVVASVEEALTRRGAPSP
jgi:tetratricopeptide (TPR) repeat protein